MIFPSFLQRGIGNLDKMDNIIENWTQSLMTKVIYTCSRSWLLADKSRNLSQAQKKVTAVKPEQILHKMTIIFTQNGQKLSF